MTTNRRTLIDNYRRRRARRGAAMVEASFVVGVLVVFWGLMQWTRQSYSDKLDQMGTTRSNSSYYAAHDCEKGDATAVLGGASPVGQDEPSGKVLNKGGGAGSDGASEKTSRGLNMATAKKDSTTTGWTKMSEKGSMQTFTLSRPIHSESYMYCNEKTYDSDPVSWVKFVGRFFQTGGGVLGN